MKVSVVVTIYNTELYFERCLRSLFEQTLKNIEFIFIDDCSPDNSLSLLKTVIEDYPERKEYVRIVTFDENMGSSYAKRIGIQLAKGEYIGSVDSDDWVEKDAFEKMLNVAEVNNADIVCCEISRETINGQRIERYQYDVETKNDVVNNLEFGIYSSLANKLIKNTLYIKYDILPLENISMWDDLSATARLRYHSAKTVIIHDALYHYNNLNNNSVTHQTDLKNILSMISCGDFLANYFKPVMPRKHYLKLMRLCFRAKDPLFYPPFYDLGTWRESIKDTNKYILFYTDISFVRRIKYLLFLLLPYAFSDFILKKRYKL
ncbi:MAG: glycosyltransferase family 2 protein [Prevotella sp.]|nr:glycosyltransferase family 2 protein [Prevotella sp.]